MSFPQVSLILVLLLLGLNPAWAADRYVSDRLQITLRAGEGTGFKITKMLTSGEPVTILSQDKKTGYSKVKTASGKVGYVLSRQLMDEPAARERVARLEARVAALSDAPGQLRGKLDDLEARHAELQTTHRRVESERARVTQELAALTKTAGNAVRIAEERDNLRRQLRDLAKEKTALELRNQELENDATQRWFLIGAAVLLLGIVLGWLLPMLRAPRRSNAWRSL